MFALFALLTDRRGAAAALRAASCKTSRWPAVAFRRELIPIKVSEKRQRKF